MRPTPLTRLSSALSLGLVLIQTAAAQAVTTAAATTAPTTSLGGSFLQMLFGLALVLVLLFSGLWVLKKLTGSGIQSNNLVRVIGATAIGTRERIVVVEMGQTWLVLGVTPNSINTLAEMPRQALPPSNTPSPADFAGWLRNTLNRRNAP